MSGKSEQLCRFYSRGKKCRFGDTCHYQHSETDLSCESNFTDQSYIPDESTEFYSGQREAVSTRSEEVRKYEGLNPEEGEKKLAPVSKRNSTRNSQRKTCSYFSKHKTCAFGRNCRFLHESPDSQDAVKQFSSVGTFTETSFSVSTQPVDNYRDDQQVEDYSQEDILPSQPVSEDDKKKERQICRYFEKSGRCPYRQRCRFEHKLRGNVKPQSSETQSPNDIKTEEEERENVSQKVPQKEEGTTNPKVKRRLCRFFQKGHCKSGERCRFWHPMDVIEDLTDDFEKSTVTETSDSLTGSNDNVPDKVNSELPINSKQNHRSPKSYQNRAVVRPVSQKISIKRETASQEEIEKLRRTEIDQLQKRFPKDRCAVVKNESDVFECRVKFVPSDPDWPFDVKKFELLFTIPSAYPCEMLTITLPLDQDLPETVRRYIELCVADWVIDKGQQLEEAGVYEIVFRPFLRWFDKSLEVNVTEALRQMKREIMAKAAGFEFINAAELQSKYKAAREEAGSDEEKSVEEEESEEGEEEDEDSDEVEDDSAKAPNVAVDMEAERKGTEVSLKFLQLREGAATLVFEKIRIVIQCGRCKNHSDFSTPPRRVNSISCSKCNSSQLLTFRPVIVHQFSSVIGYLDLDNCTVHDLVLQDSVVMVGCMGCSKQSKIDGLAPGQPLNTWCRHCHQKMMIAAETVKFAQLQPSCILTDQHQIHQIATKKRVQKDPSIQEGKPLPEYGACKHYKKSYRWFRFPCCGMVYPCDVCHEEKSDGHEMVFANRVVCGFCCKEQPYSPDKPCTMCQQMLTRAKTTHWEGGLGCRSKIKMSKNDSQKYSNMNKTVSRHAQKLKENNSKKKTKLRHA